MGVSVFTVFMDNVNPEVAKWQKRVVSRFLPRGWKFFQYRTSLSHPESLHACVERNEDEITVFLDVDCIPLSYQSFNYLLDNRWSVKHGALIGAVQRANHINNKGHLYVGPFCMAFRNDTFRDLGSPTFYETCRGDTGEELTYCWQEANKPVYFLWPSDVQEPQWSLIDG